MLRVKRALIKEFGLMKPPIFRVLGTTGWIRIGIGV